MLSYVFGFILNQTFTTNKPCMEFINVQGNNYNVI